MLLTLNVDLIMKEIKREEYGPEGWFNDGVIVHKDLEKPCLKIGWCPYGWIAEAFWPSRGYFYSDFIKYHCNAFGHDCPVFYIAEKVTENSDKIPSKNIALTDDVSRLKLSKRKMKLYHPPDYSFEKPCLILNFCPYGSFAQYYSNEEGKEPYKCKLYKKECPVYFFGFSATDRER